VASALVLLLPGRAGFGWGHEGHTVVALIAEHYMTSAAVAKAGDLLDDAPIDAVASWADDYRRDHRETGPWHYIDIPLADSKINMSHECPEGQCVIARTEHFLSVLKDPSAGRAARAEALKFVVHFVGDLHRCTTRTTATRAETPVTSSLTASLTICIGRGTRACSKTSTQTRRRSQRNWSGALCRKTEPNGKRAPLRIG
jgi:hypothetical protein